ncbi:MAG: glycosyltransferase family 2 protein [Candidatus Nomurabacteria bacterium]|nr:glycosyltransferase family 2 protein [Candidatus Nomurabacteria bacterium]
MENKTDNKIAILMVVRNEESFIDLNISYHLSIGFDYIFIANHCSTDKTNDILESYNADKRIIVIKEEDPVFDHAKIANKLLSFANKNFKVDWFFMLDADEFVSMKDKTIHAFIDRLEKAGIVYATIGWANALFECSRAQATPIDTNCYYLPWPEKPWQEFGHFRKAIIKNHKNIEIVVGGHYVKSRNNPDFFGTYTSNPFIIPYNEAKLLHYEFRNTAKMIYEKWKKLAKYERDSSSNDNSPWLERIQTIKNYVIEFKDNLEKVNEMWFSEHRTFWGTVIEKNKIITDNTLNFWYKTYFINKIKNREINSICLIRKGNLGDVIMTEPIARYLHKYVNKVYLATNINNINNLLPAYDGIINYSDINDFDGVDIKIKLNYENSRNDKTYIQGFAESAGIDENINNLPFLNDKHDVLMKEKYVLIAPNTSSWQENKRNWGIKNYKDLSFLIIEELRVKVIFLDDSNSFKEMLSLIKYCEFFIGNDSGPAIIAQSFKKKSFMIFGATHPKYLNLNKETISIYNKNRHILCNHTKRQEEIDCCEEFCFDKIIPNFVFEVIKNNI